jgi:hypothetical protein
MACAKEMVSNLMKNAAFFSGSSGLSSLKALPSLQEAAFMLHTWKYSLNYSDGGFRAGTEDFLIQST